MKLLYSFPAFLYCGFLTFVGFGVGFGGFQMEAWIYVFLLISAAILLSMKKWWGAIPGMAVGSIVMYLFETTNAHQHINVTPLGIGILVYFGFMGMICYKLNRKTE